MNAERNRTRIIRLYKIEELLITQSGLTAIELCERMKVNRRTIYRDIELMQELGIPLYKDNSRFKILGTYKIPSYRIQLIDQKTEKAVS
jgi:predicted DNA-binding transcriptional regulator YafY